MHHGRISRCPVAPLWLVAAAVLLATASSRVAAQPLGATGQEPQEGTLIAPQIEGRFEVPLAGGVPEEIFVEANQGLITLIVRNGSLQDVVTALAETQGLNVVTAGGLDATVSTTLDRVPLPDALDAVLSAAGFTWTLNKNIVHVTSLSAADNIPPQMQGRRVEVFHLDYATAEDVNTVISAMLSPVGQSFPITSADADNLRTREVLVVEDLAPYLQRVREQLARIDVPPRQVLIEVHVLEVELDETTRHGINFEHAFNLRSNLLQLETTGLASDSSSQAFLVNLSGGNLASLLECLRSTTDAKTLASPRILCLNGQLARIQVGEQLGFRVTTTTETSTTESVEFLDVGVVLEVTPRISQDGRVMIRVRPEVSNGQVSASTGLPEEETTELETDVLLGDNQGLVIGGLIQETDSDIQAKIPILGDLHYVGKLFQRKETTKRRTEIIVALLPRVIPYDPLYQERADTDQIRAETRLLHGPLHRFPRPWEAKLHDSIENPQFVRLPPVREVFKCNRSAGCRCDACSGGWEYAAPALRAVPSVHVDEVQATSWETLATFDLNSVPAAAPEPRLLMPRRLPPASDPWMRTPGPRTPGPPRSSSSPMLR